MKSNHFKFVGEYISWLVKQYQALQQYNQQTYLYKIVDKETCKKTSENIFIVQLTGKNAFLKMSARAIAADDVMLRGFSPLDVRTITYFACKEHFDEKKKDESQPKQNLLYRIISMAFSRRQKKQMIVIEQINKPELITTSIQALSNNPDMIDGFSPTDAHRIGYAAGAESVTSPRGVC